MAADHLRSMNAVLSDGTQVHLEPLEAEALEQKLKLSGLEGSLYRRMVDLTRSPENRKTILEGTPRHWRRCGGYNLDRFIGDGPSFKVPQERPL